MKELISGVESENVKVVKAPPDAPENWMEALRKEPKRIVRINKQEGHEGTDDVKIGINGYVLQIKRGFDVVIGESFLQNLKDCRYVLYGKDDNANDVIVEVPRFSFEDKGPAPEQKAA